MREGCQCWSSDRLSFGQSQYYWQRGTFSILYYRRPLASHVEAIVTLRLSEVVQESAHHPDKVSYHPSTVRCCSIPVTLKAAAWASLE